MSVVRVTLTHSVRPNVVPEKRYGLAQSIESIKENTTSHFGTPATQVRLELYDDRGVKVESDMKDDKMLGYYQCRDGFRIHVVDLAPAETAAVNYDDVSQVEKFELSEEEWLKRSDNMRAFKERMKAQQRAQMEADGVAPPAELDADSYREAAEAIKVGDRCCCQPGDRLGTVAYVGRVAPLKPGFWVGVRFDEPVGKSDGSVKGVRVFECEKLYGGFLRPDQVQVGDYPEEDFS